MEPRAADSQYLLLQAQMAALLKKVQLIDCTSHNFRVSVVEVSFCNFFSKNYLYCVYLTAFVLKTDTELYICQ